MRPCGKDTGVDRRQKTEVRGRPRPSLCEDLHRKGKARLGVMHRIGWFEYLGWTLG